jgi:hypothetical protein
MDEMEQKKKEKVFEEKEIIEKLEENLIEANNKNIL